MTEQSTPPPTLPALIRGRMDETGWTYVDLSHRIGGRLTAARLAQLGGGRRIKEFPEPATLVLLAAALEVAPVTVVLAAAASLGIDVHTEADELAALLPPGTARLSGRMRAAIASLVRAAVADATQRDLDDPVAPLATPDQSKDLTLEWSKTQPVSNGNVTERRADWHG